MAIDIQEVVFQLMFFGILLKHQKIFGYQSKVCKIIVGGVNISKVFSY
tara:strand:+ start:1703 stop:1846 length:144 start_codon:yes stop_codon:yes gene_type:complete